MASTKYVATEEFEAFDENDQVRTFKRGDTVPDGVVADMWAEGGGTSNPRLRLPVRRVTA